MIKFYCNCGKKIGVPEQYAGRRVLCPQCGAAHVTPQPATAAAIMVTPAVEVPPTMPPEYPQAAPEYPPAEAGYPQAESYAPQAEAYAPQADSDYPPAPGYSQDVGGYAPAATDYPHYPQAEPAYPSAADVDPSDALAAAASAAAPPSYSQSYPQSYSPYPTSYDPRMAVPPARPTRPAGFPAWAWGAVAAGVVVVGVGAWAALKFSGRPAGPMAAPTVAIAGGDTTAAAPPAAGASPAVATKEDMDNMDGQLVGGPGGLKARPGWLSGTAEKPAAPAGGPAAAPSAAVAPRGPDLSPADLFSRASPAVVKVIVSDKSGHPFAQGSGFFVDADGVLVTNYHVIRGATKAQVEIPGSGAYDVTGVLAHDKDMDLAVLKVAVGGQTALKLATDVPPVGSRVFAIGSPLGLTNTLSEGLVSGIRGADSDSGPAIQTSAAISHGSSGGPLLSADGRVVGVTSAGIEGGQNLNLAIPAAEVERLLRNQGTPVPLTDVTGRPRGRPTTGPAAKPAAKPKG